jgi:hypothetical protein
MRTSDAGAYKTAGTAFSGFNVDDEPVIHVSNGVRELKDPAVMCYHDDGAIRPHGALGKKFHDSMAGLGVEG